MDKKQEKTKSSIIVTWIILLILSIGLNGLQYNAKIELDTSFFNLNIKYSEQTTYLAESKQSETILKNELIENTKKFQENELILMENILKLQKADDLFATGLIYNKISSVSVNLANILYEDYILTNELSDLVDSLYSIPTIFDSEMTYYLKSSKNIYTEIEFSNSTLNDNIEIKIDIIESLLRLLELSEQEYETELEEIQITSRMEDEFLFLTEKFEKLRNLENNDVYLDLYN